MKLTTPAFSEFDTPAETARKLNAMFIQLQHRLDVGSVRVGDTTKLDHNGDITCADVTCEDVTAEDVTCEDVDAEDVDIETFTMATGAGADKILTSDADGAGTWVAPAVQVAGSDTEVQFNDGGAFAGDPTFTFNKTSDVLSLDHLDMDGTETDELIDLDRVIDASVTKSAVTVTETRTGTIGSDGHAGFEYEGTISGISGTCPEHHGFKSTVLIPDGSAVTKPSCFEGLLDSDSSGTPPTNAAVFRGFMGLDNIAPPTLNANAAMLCGVSASRSGELFGLFAKAVNWGTGKAIGFWARGQCSGSTDKLRGIGAWLVGAATSGVSAGCFAEPATKDANGLAYVGKGHSLLYHGNLYLHDTTSDPTVTAIANKSHVTEAEDGSLYVENQLEVDGPGHFDNDLTVDYEFKGARCCFDGAENGTPSASRYLDLNNGLIMAAQRGYTMAHAGSIISVSGCGNIASNSSGAEVHIEARINGGEEASADYVTTQVNDTGDKAWYQTGARHGASFSAGDVLTIYLNIVGTLSIASPSGVVEVQFDD